MCWDGVVVRRVTWSQYRESIGDRSGLFPALAYGWPIERALYPGSYVDLSPSTAFASVVYVDSDARAGRFFADPDLVAAELAGRTRPGARREVRFIGADYTDRLDLAEGGVDLLISLFAGPVWHHCGRYLRPGGWLLANTSHGDASPVVFEGRTYQWVAASGVQTGAELGTGVTPRCDDGQPVPAETLRDPLVEAVGLDPTEAVALVRGGGQVDLLVRSDHTATRSVNAHGPPPARHLPAAKTNPRGP